MHPVKILIRLHSESDLHSNRWHFFIRKLLVSFLFLNENICCGYSLEVPRWGASNEYPQDMFLSRNKKNIMWIPPLICSYGSESLLGAHVRRYIFMMCTENSNQPAHPCSLIRVFVVQMKKLHILGYQKCTQWRFWSDCIFLTLWLMWFVCCAGCEALLQKTRSSKEVDGSGLSSYGGMFWCPVCLAACEEK